MIPAASTISGNGTLRKKMPTKARAARTSIDRLLSARLPTREEAEVLQIRPDTPVLVLLHVGYDADHRPIEVAQATWPGPNTTLTEQYRVPGPRPGLPDGEPDIALG